MYKYYNGKTTFFLEKIFLHSFTAKSNHLLEQ